MAERSSCFGRTGKSIAALNPKLGRLGYCHFRFIVLCSLYKARYGLFITYILDELKHEGIEMLELYRELALNPVFSVNAFAQRYSSRDSARSALKRLLRAGLIERVRHGLYVCLSATTGEPMATRFQIASAITPTSYVSHHSAFEYLGIANQVSHEVCVSSATRFPAFSFHGYEYRFLHFSLADGMAIPGLDKGVRVANRERAVVESIRDLDRVGGLEEVFDNISFLENLDEAKILRYLAHGNHFLWQKTGFLLSCVGEQLGLSGSFFDLCRLKAGKSTRYLTTDYYPCRYDKEWRLVVPKWLGAGGSDALYAWL